MQNIFLLKCFLLFIFFLKTGHVTDTNDNGHFFVTIHREEGDARLARAPQPNDSPLGWDTPHRSYSRPKGQLTGCLSP